MNVSSSSSASALVDIATGSWIDPFANDTADTSPTSPASAVPSVSANGMSTAAVGLGRTYTNTRAPVPSSTSATSATTLTSVAPSSSNTSTVDDDAASTVYPLPAFNVTVTDPDASSVLSPTVCTSKPSQPPVMSADWVPRSPDATKLPDCVTVYDTDSVPDTAGDADTLKYAVEPSVVTEPGSSFNTGSDPPTPPTTKTCDSPYRVSCVSSDARCAVPPTTGPPGSPPGLPAFARSTPPVGVTVPKCSAEALAPPDAEPVHGRFADENVTAVPASSRKGVTS